MIATPRTARTTKPASATSGKTFNLSQVRTGSAHSPLRMGLHAKPGWGKSSLGTNFPKPFFIETENGLDALIEYGLVKDTPRFPPVKTWDDVNAAINALIEQDHGYKTAVFDTLNGIERLCHEYVCEHEFNGEWGDKGFGGYQRGFEVSLAPWREFLNKLDTLRDSKGMMVLFLSHTKINTFKNPSGPDYDRWAPDMHPKTWALTQRWLDAVFFGDFEVAVDAPGKDNLLKKGKAVGNSIRVLYTTESPSFDAKNRMGLPEDIDVGDSAADAWKNLADAIKQSRKPEDTTAPKGADKKKEVSSNE